MWHVPAVWLTGPVCLKLVKLDKLVSCRSWLVLLPCSIPCCRPLPSSSPFSWPLACNHMYAHPYLVAGPCLADTYINACCLHYTAKIKRTNQMILAGAHWYPPQILAAPVQALQALAGLTCAAKAVPFMHLVLHLLSLSVVNETNLWAPTSGDVATTHGLFATWTYLPFGSGSTRIESFNTHGSLHARRQIRSQQQAAHSRPTQRKSHLRLMSALSLTCRQDKARHQRCKFEFERLSI